MTTTADPGYGRGLLFGPLFQWPGVTRASTPFVPMQSYVCFMLFIDEINQQCKGDLSCAGTSALTMFIRGVQCHSCEWLKHSSEKRGTPPTVALVSGNTTCSFFVYIPCAWSIPFPTPSIMQCYIGNSHSANNLLEKLVALKYHLTVDR